MKRILVTGATGFVGGALTRKLVSLGYEVHVFTRKTSEKWRINDLQKSIIEHEVDLRNLEELKRVIRVIKPRIIYHLATHGGFHFQQNPTEIIETNFIGTMNLLLACQEIEFDYFVNTGSSSEYGIKNKKMSESDLPIPLGDYGVSKVASTLYCQSIRLQKQLPIITLRLFSPYGPWDAPSRFIPYVIKSYLEGLPPKVTTPSSVRDYIYIEDALDIYLKFIKSSYINCDIINVGSGSQISLGQITETIKRTVDNEIEPVWGALDKPRIEPEVWQADITLARDLLEWSPKTSFEEGIAKTVNWIKNNDSYY